MPNFAVLNKNNEVINVIVADSLEIAMTATQANCAELPEIGFGIGDTYDAINNIFISSQPIIDIEEVTPTPALEG